MLKEAHQIVMRDIHRHPCGAFSRNAGIFIQKWAHGVAANYAEAAGEGVSKDATKRAPSSTAGDPKGNTTRWVRGMTIGSMAGSSMGADTTAYGLVEKV